MKEREHYLQNWCDALFTAHLFSQWNAFFYPDSPLVLKKKKPCHHFKPFKLTCLLLTVVTSHVGTDVVPCHAPHQYLFLFQVFPCEAEFLPCVLKCSESSWTFQLPCISHGKVNTEFFFFFLYLAVLAAVSKLSELADIFWGCCVV